MPARLFVIGATGYLGSRIVERAAAVMPTFGTSSRGTGCARLDLLHAGEFDYSQLHAGDAALVCGGVSAPDACASDRPRAWAINVEGTTAFIERAAGAGARVIFLSSDTVYGERDAEFDESAPCHPLGDYAEMKHAVERRFESHAQVKTLRLSYAFSAEDSFTRHLRDCAARGEEAEIFHPFYRAAVHRDDVAEAAIALARRWEAFPVFAINAGGPEVVSRLDCARLLRDTALPQLRFRTVEPGPQFFHNRPRVIRMKSPHMTALLGRPPRTLREAVRLELGPA